MQTSDMVSRPSATCAVAYNDGVHSWPWQPLQRLPIPFSAASAKEKGGRRRRRRWKAILAQKSSSGVAFIIDSIPFVFRTDRGETYQQLRVAQN